MMNNLRSKALRLGLTTLSGFLLLLIALSVIRNNGLVAHAESSTPNPDSVASARMPPSTQSAEGEITATHVISPPEGYPKLDQSMKTVTPTLASTGDETLYYTIEIHNTGAWTASNATLTDVIPPGTSYNGDGQASNGTVNFASGTLTWQGIVGFNSSVVISYSVNVSSTFEGTVNNTAVISDPLLTEPVTLTAETIVTDQPVLAIGKTSAPVKPGANKPLTYTLVVTNRGQPAVSLPITVTDQVPSNTTLREVGADGSTNPPANNVVTWTRQVNLDHGQTTEFTFSVDVGNVPSGTVIANQNYQVTSAATGVTTGDLYTVTVVDPILSLFKETWPDPPGANREMTYTLTVLNRGSLATSLVVTDRVPSGVAYQRGGTYAGGIVSWTWPGLDTNEAAQFTFTVSISNVADISIVNSDYGVCSTTEGVCQPGTVLTRFVKPPSFEAIAMLDPIAKKPGGGGGPVTPTLVIRNLGPGNASDATALLKYQHISINNVGELEAIPPKGTLNDGPDCGEKCFAYVWVGDLAYGEVITFMPTLKQESRGRSTIVGEEGTIYTATVVVTDSLSNMTTDPVTGTETGKITHFANLIPIKSAPPVVGPGQLLTYTINVWNSALSTEEPPYPVLTDVVPTGTTFVSASGGGMTQTISNTTIVSWTLPAMSTSETLTRTFTVHVNDDLISGTQIINGDYGTTWYESDVPDITGTVVFSNTGEPVTTTVREVGLIHSYKEVAPEAVAPGGVVTYYVHIVNSSGNMLNDVTVEDLLPWQFSTYRRDAVASGGTLTEVDIVSVHWQGDLAPFSSEVITFSVVANPDYEGLLTNTAIISHPGLLGEITRQAVAYVTTKPVLRISKSASPNPVKRGSELLYTIRVEILGQQATELVITDTIPAGTTYIPGSATAGGQLVGDQVQWQVLALAPGESRTFEFRVTVIEGNTIINDQYGVSCAEGATAAGRQTVTQVSGGGGGVYLPIILKGG